MSRSRLLVVALLLAACKSRPAPAVPSPTPAPGGAVTDEELHAAAESAGCRVLHREGRIVRLDCGAERRDIDLTNLDREISAAKDHGERVARTAKFLTPSIPTASAERSDEIPRDRLLPMLKSRASIEATLARVPEEKRGSITIPMQPIAGETVLVIAIDGADSMETVTSAHLARWKVPDAGELAALAIANLASRPSPAPAKQPDGTVLVNSGDSYDASRILVPETRLRIEEALGGAAIYAIPDRDHLLAVRADDDRAIAALREESRALSKRASHAITPDLLRYANNRFEVVP